MVDRGAERKLANLCGPMSEAPRDGRGILAKSEAGFSSFAIGDGRSCQARRTCLGRKYTMAEAAGYLDTQFLSAGSIRPSLKLWDYATARRPPDRLYRRCPNLPAMQRGAGDVGAPRQGRTKKKAELKNPAWAPFLGRPGRRYQGPLAAASFSFIFAGSGAPRPPTASRLSLKY